jgi:hypothetical protein
VARAERVKEISGVEGLTWRDGTKRFHASVDQSPGRLGHGLKDNRSSRTAACFIPRHRRQLSGRRALTGLDRGRIIASAVAGNSSAARAKEDA